MGPIDFANRQNAHLAFRLPRPKSGGGMIPGHVRDGVMTEATNDYAGPILPGFRETAWIQKSPYFHRAAKHGVRAYDLYNHMLMPGLYTDPVEEYWHLVNHVTLWDVGVERQVEIDGPDGFEFMQMLTPRDMEKCGVGECKYVLLTTPDGGIINDPVLLRLGEDHFWLSLSDWDVLFWCKGVAVNAGLDVIVREPDVSPLQLQGPKSKDVMVDLFGEDILDLEYYHLTETQLDGIPLVITRTGWSAERGYELYLRAARREALGCGHGRGREVRHPAGRPVRDPADRGGDPELQLGHHARQQSVRGRPRLDGGRGQEIGLPGEGRARSNEE